MAPRQSRADHTTPADRTVTLTEEQWQRVTQLAETATVRQTTEQVLETVLRQGLKAVEKRRKETQEARADKAEALLRAMGRLA